VAEDESQETILELKHFISEMKDDFQSQIQGLEASAAELEVTLPPSHSGVHLYMCACVRVCLCAFV